MDYCTDHCEHQRLKKKRKRNLMWKNWFAYIVIYNLIYSSKWGSNRVKISCWWFFILIYCSFWNREGKDGNQMMKIVKVKLIIFHSCDWVIIIPTNCLKFFPKLLLQFSEAIIAIIINVDHYHFEVTSSTFQNVYRWCSWWKSAQKDQKSA